jgi:hypothetical protein
MTMAAAFDSRTAQAGHWSKASRLAAVDIVTDLGQAEAVWRELESRHPSDGRQHILRHAPRYVRDEFVSWRHQLHRFDELSFVLVQPHAVDSVRISRFLVFHRFLSFRLHVKS